MIAAELWRMVDVLNCVPNEFGMYDVRCHCGAMLWRSAEELQYCDDVELMCTDCQKYWGMI